MHMFLVGLIQWWYTRGWRDQLLASRRRIAATADFFSLSTLAMTLFAPYRQISAGSVRGSVAVQLRAFFDKTISRLIGAIVRLTTILSGSVVIVIQLGIELIVAVMWPLWPLLPIVGLIAFAIGWVPA